MPKGTDILRHGATAYYGNRRFLMLATSFVLDRSSSPYRRLSAALMMACGEPFRLEVGGGLTQTTRAALIAPKVRRHRTVALDSRLAIFDIPIGSPEYAALEPTLVQQQVLALELERFASLLPTLEKGFGETLTRAEVDGLFESAVFAVTGQRPPARILDPRIARAIDLIDELPLDQVGLATLAKQLALSASRLRHLFQTETGCSVTQYARWAAVWKAASLWTRGMPLTEIAHEVGFYDLAHLDHAFVETFGVSPSIVIDPSRITLVRCP
jgi:AraC-like DNA-binding protein